MYLLIFPSTRDNALLEVDERDSQIQEFISSKGLIIGDISRRLFSRVSSESAFPDFRLTSWLQRGISSPPLESLILWPGLSMARASSVLFISRISSLAKPQSGDFPSRLATDSSSFIASHRKIRLAGFEVISPLARACLAAVPN
ncbi:hypothetical protein KM043_005832 [Ampulex compressa]|nr:hypothetical protein KM043_005832 [Ampulex compressa]